ncbi:hypothetical protein GIB67_025876 [Kingdonia uniflora]|uniref:Uncharacterized protein n=1 Tax=Kingdonia uniflora TaxID=39325 RepID=A0A7J7MDP2_9MAGN|nr:hypothetical protein GIB67_025876 [Kingdonia uniflora]
MAKFFSTSIVVLVLIISHEVFLAEGVRHLKSGKGKDFNKCLGCESNTLKASTKGEKHLMVGEWHSDSPSFVQHVDDFRPTAPGHSPGVGHSIQN